MGHAWPWMWVPPYKTSSLCHICHPPAQPVGVGLELGLGLGLEEVFVFDLGLGLGLGLVSGSSFTRLFGMTYDVQDRPCYATPLSA